MKKSLLYNAWGHLKTITSHKFRVMGLCFRVGLIWQGLMHDNSKYSPIEFFAGVKYYQDGVKSPNAAQKKEIGYSASWLHHKGRNKHHFEYWFDSTYKPGERVVAGRMPTKYVLEMACDRISACKTYHGDKYTQHDPLEYYNLKKEYVEPSLHPDTAKLLVDILTVLDKEGEETCIQYMRRLRKQK